MFVPGYHAPFVFPAHNNMTAFLTYLVKSWFFECLDGPSLAGRPYLGTFRHVKIIFFMHDCGKCASRQAGDLGRWKASVHDRGFLFSVYKHLQFLSHFKHYIFVVIRNNLDAISFMIYYCWYERQRNHKTTQAR